MENNIPSLVSVNKSQRIVDVHSKSSYIFWLLICLIVITCLQSLKKAYDNDAWWLIATGREIIQQGFPRINPWAVHEGMRIVIQQWIPSVILYVVYSLGGFPAIEVFIVIQVAILIAVMFYTCRYYSGNKNNSCLLFILISTVSLSSYFSSRPHLYTMVLYLMVVFILEKYRATNNNRYLFYLPLLTLIHANVHSSMAIFDLFVIFAYWIPDPTAYLNKLTKKGCALRFKDSIYKRKPLFLCAIACIISMCFNPYGIEGVLYLVNSYGAANYGDYIKELAPTIMFSPYGIADLILIIGGAIIVGMNGRNVDFPLTFIFLVTSILSVQHSRNVWLVALFSLPLIARGIRNIEFPLLHLPKLHNKVCYIAFGLILVDALAIYSYSVVWPTLVNNILIYKTDTFDLPLKACEWLDEYATENNLEKGSIKVFNTFNNGGVLELRGYKVLMDPRPELWEPGITGLPEHFYKEYVDFQFERISAEDYIKKYSFDFYLVRDGSSTEEYFLSNQNLFESKLECNGYKVWGNKTVIN